MARHREQVRQGLLTRGLHRGAFEKEWGPPDRTVSLPSEGYRPRAFDGWEPIVYEIWEYRSHGTCLVFDKVRLVSWQTGRTDCTPRPATREKGAATRRGPQPYPPYPE